MVGRMGLGLWLGSRPFGGTAQPSETTLVRETDGTITITNISSTWAPNTTREADGTVTVGA